MDSSEFEEMVDVDTLKRQRHRKSQVTHHSTRSKSMRGNPEGNSVIQREKIKMTAVPIYDYGQENSPMMHKHKLAHGDNFNTPLEKQLVRQVKELNDSCGDMLNSSNTPNTLSQISSIAPYMSDTSTESESTFTQFKKPRPTTQDVTWEQAVERARGQPDGAERSMHQTKVAKVQKKLECVELTDVGEKDVEEWEDDEQEVKEKKQPSEVKLLRGKSIKLHLKQAKQKLKALKTKSKPDPVNLGVKRRNDSTLMDKSDGKKPKLEEMSKKERKQVRKMLKINHDTIQKAKNVWNELRRHDISDDKKVLLCDDLLKMVKGKIKDFAFAHDTARVIQCLIQYGNAEQKTVVFEEMREHFPVMVKAKYAKHLMKKFLLYGSKPQRNMIFKSFHGHVRKLMRHKEASGIVECAYNDYANAPQRLSLLEEFYGPSFALFKTHDTKTLDHVMLSQPDKRDMIISNMKESLLPLIDKSILQHSMVHRIFYEFFMYASEKMRTEMIEAVRESVLHMLHTRDGSRVAMYCIWHGTAKDRKVIMKSFKTHIEKISKEEYGHLALLALFDVVDDTKLMQKIVLEEILKCLSALAHDAHGRKVLLYLLNPRDPVHFHPDIIRVLQEGDNNSKSKKDKVVRHSELLAFVSQPLLKMLMSDVKGLVKNTNTMLLAVAIIQHSTVVPTEAMKAVATIAAEPFIAGSPDNLHLVEHPAGHIALKRLILNDKERTKAGESVLFSQILLKSLKDGTLKSWAACNRGCFILVSLLEVENNQIIQNVRLQLSGIKKSIRKMTFKGAQVLLQKLGE